MAYDTPSEASSPLSFLSRSPTPPGSSFDDYPSPPSSSLASLKGSPAPDGMDSAGARGEDGRPPAKRRRLAEPQDRTTQRLNLRTGELAPEQQAQFDRLMKTLHKKRKIVVVVGAGISVSAGIPDFRSGKGLFKQLKTQHNLKSTGKDLFDASLYGNQKTTSAFHDMIRDLSQKAKDAEPTAFHQMLATLAQDGRLLRLYSQNIDGLDIGLPPLATETPLRQKDGKWPKTVLLHGGLEKMICSKCRNLWDFQPELFEGPTAPSCKTCEETDAVRTEHAGKRSHGIGMLRPRMVLYNEDNPDAETIGSVVKADMRTRPDAVIVAGTTLAVPGIRTIVKEMCGIVKNRKDGMAIWINPDPPPQAYGLGDCWDLVVNGTCDDVARFAALGKWDDEKGIEEVSDEQVVKVKAETGMVEVAVPSPLKSKSFADILGVPTPAPSPQLGPQPLPSILLKEKSKAAKPATKTKATQKAPTKVKGTKATASKKAAPKKATASNTKLNFTISKPASAAAKVGSKAKPGETKSRPKSLPKSKRPSGASGQPEPMAPISPLEARNNSIIPQDMPLEDEKSSPPQKPLAALENMDRPRARSSTGSTGSLNSPTNSVPRGMEFLMNPTD